MYTRRKFLGQIFAGAGMVFLPGLSFCKRETNVDIRIGFISGILNNNLSGENWKEVLRKTPEFGYTEYEGGVMGDAPEEFLSFCREIGLTPIAGGVPFGSDMDKLKAALDVLNKLEMKYAVTYWPWLSGGPFGLEDCKSSSDLLNKMGEVAQAQGLQLCWHNHDKEFIPMEEGLPFDYLMGNTEKEIVSCELDVYWAKKGGAEPLQLLQKYGERIQILHIKDMADDAAQSITCPGSGIMDFSSIIREAQKQKIKHFFVERDKAENGLECLQIAADAIRNIDFIRI